MITPELSAILVIFGGTGDLSHRKLMPALYNLVNDRLMENKPMVISTNLNVEEMARRYSPQIASRMQGGFTPLTFVGEDIRVLKNRGI